MNVEEGRLYGHEIQHPEIHHHASQEVPPRVNFEEVNIRAELVANGIIGLL